ncbi:MAG: adenosylcobalamin-dependent ribonucleoside-diphosphate reductase [Chloroflexi bacterium]|nr:adenosylcobalamin-dependent ribonucleoside-diphosphate reductase [Chloroflexota bacterium]MDA1240599.1 adenosylcobalamin-dependent ribonucleoside-diphosphate reductase [Chloroflexota bacterium]MQC19255.1 adenosylcobalamin-dependent ribonucleoside-diphosphate reductase [Chloroflexota bacterium]
MVAVDEIRTTPVALAENARTVLERRYLLRDAAGEVIETPEALFARVAIAIAAAEPAEAARREWAQRFYDEMAALRFLPNSPTLMNAGTGQGTLAACFVLPVDDTLESIMSTAEATAMVQKYGGGTGFDFSRLRGRGEPIRTTHGAACGPVSVLRHYDDVSRLVTQGGKRDGANMGILRADHPDIEEFIRAKDDGVTATRFNISVAATDAFMAAAEAGEPFTLRDPRDGAERGQVDARALLREIAQGAWQTGDPGLIFLDTINRANPTPALGPIEATNPCGEVPLLPWEACTLGSVNVARFWDAERSDVDWEALRGTVRVAVRFLDNVVEVNEFPVPQITEAVRGNRKIGLGLMGWADLLVAAAIPYASEEALALAGRLMSTVGTEADETSAALGAEKGPFPNLDRSIYAGGPRYRNATRTCIAPTGTIAIIAGASSGIEPYFSLAHVRRMGDGTLLPEVNEAFRAVAREGGFASDELFDDLAHGARLDEVEGVPAEVRARFATSHEIAPSWHVRMQAAFQAHTDLAVSKTVNLPHEATPEQVLEVYTLAHRLGCKGVTVYRDGSRALQVLAHTSDAASSGSKAPAVALDGTEHTVGAPARRHLPDERQSITHKFRVGDQEGYITVGLFDDGRPGELFLKIAKEGSTVSGLTDAVALLTSLSLQYGVSIDKIATKFEQTRFEPYGVTANREIPFATSILDYVFKWLRLRFGDPSAVRDVTASGLTCPDCGQQMEFVEQCLTCRNCGYSRCS